MPGIDWSAMTAGPEIHTDQILNSMMRTDAEQHGAQTAEEGDKYIALRTDINNLNWRNVDLLWISKPDGTRTLQISIQLYSDRSHKAFFYDEVPTAEQLMERNLVVDSEGDFDVEEMVGVCESCGQKFCVEKLECLIDEDELWCHECTQENAHHCDRCGHWFKYDDEFEEVYRDYDNYEGYWCPACQRAVDAYWDDDDERMYINTGGKMQKYYNPEGVLKNGVHDCPDCADSPEGWCPRHLKIKIEEMEAEATHLWVYDTMRRDYHCGDHKRFKSLKYRMPNEHPYLYYGIELEVLWLASKGSYDKVTEEFIKATGGMFVAEYDRSVDERGHCLGNYIGAEFISRPTSYKRWTDPKTIEALKKGLEVLKKYGATNPQDEGCGLHVHMSKVFFENKTKKKVKDIKSDMDWFFQYFQPEIEKISRRPYTQYCASKAFRMQNAVNDFKGNNMMFGVKGKFQMEKGQLTVSSGSGITHHDCIIETPRTIEARTFKSTIIAEEILATIEFCRGLAHAARNRTGLTGKTFGDIMFTKDSPYLLNYVDKLHLDTSRELKTKLEVKI